MDNSLWKLKFNSVKSSIGSVKLISLSIETYHGQFWELFHLKQLIVNWNIDLLRARIVSWI